jgi:iron complex outermembrane recepter protein
MLGLHLARGQEPDRGEQGIMEGVVTGDLFELPAGTVQSAFGAATATSTLTSSRTAACSRASWWASTSSCRFRASCGTPTSSPRSWYRWSPTAGHPEPVDHAGGPHHGQQHLRQRKTWKVTVRLDRSTTSSGPVAVFQHAIRSPNIAELFSPQLNNFPTFTNQDPCNFDSSERRTVAERTRRRSQALCARRRRSQVARTSSSRSARLPGITAATPT